MKKLQVKIIAEMEIPDDWEVVEHPAGITVLQVGDKFVDIDIAPLTTASVDPDAMWSDEDQALIDQVLDTLTEMDAELTVVHRH